MESSLRLINREVEILSGLGGAIGEEQEMNISEVAAEEAPV